MKTIGLIGGLGPEATIEYYRMINTLCFEKTGGTHYPEMRIVSLDLFEFLALAEKDDREGAVQLFREAIGALHESGSDLAIICAVTPHMVFDRLEAVSPIPLISLVRETSKRVMRMGIKKVGLLGTRFTMSSSMFQEELSTCGVEVFVPGIEDQEFIHGKLEKEISRGIIEDKTREGIYSIIEKMVTRHSIRGVILGCTELPLIIDEPRYGVELLNSVEIHVESAVEYSLEE